MNQEPVYEDVDQTINIGGTSGGTTELTVSPQKFEGMHFLSPEQLPDLDGATTGISLTPKYYEGFIKEGDKVRAVYNGLTVIRSNKNVAPGDPPKEIPTVVFQNKDGVFLHSGANLVDQLRGFPAGNPIQITFLGQEKTGNGNKINKFDVVVLNVNPF